MEVHCSSVARLQIPGSSAFVRRDPSRWLSSWLSATDRGLLIPRFRVRFPARAPSVIDEHHHVCASSGDERQRAFGTHRRSADTGAAGYDFGFKLVKKSQTTALELGSPTTGPPIPK